MSYCRLGEARLDAAHIYREDRNNLLAVAWGNGRRIGEKNTGERSPDHGHRA